jgi:aminomethyltransferase
MEPVPQLNSVPLESFHCQLGAKLVPFAGYLMPVQYESILHEHHHTRQHAGLFDVSHMGTLLISGDQVAHHLERLIPCDLEELTIGETKYTLLLNDQGGIVDDLLITRLEKGFQLVLNAGRKEIDLNYLRQNLPNHLQFTPLFDHVLLALQGPQAATVMERLCQKASHLPFMHFQHVVWDNILIALSRSGYTGEDGFEIRVSPQDGPKLFSWLIEQPEVKPIGLGARDTLRLEAGLCLYGHDLNETTTPIQAGLNWTIGKRRRTAGGFAGAAKILTELQSGPHLKRIGLFIEGRAIAREGASLHTPTNEVVGHITSGSHSPTLNRPIAMGYVNAGALTFPLEVNIRGTLHPAALTKLPFVPHNYYRG